MSKEKEIFDKRFHFAISQEILDGIEQYRKSCSKVPSTAKAIRDLLKYALTNIHREQPVK